MITVANLRTYWGSMQRTADAYWAIGNAAFIGLKTFRKGPSYPPEVVYDARGRTISLYDPSKEGLTAVTRIGIRDGAKRQRLELSDAEAVDFLNRNGVGVPSVPVAQPGTPSE